MAMTTKYVTTTGAGAKNGTDAANAWDWATMLTSAAAGDDILIQEGTYSLSASSTFTNAGTSTSPIRLRGAKTDWTPLSPTRTSAGALSTTNMPVIAYGDTYSLNIPSWMIVFGLKVTGKINGNLISHSSDGCTVSCIVENSSTGSDICCVGQSSRVITVNCDVSLTGASGGAAGFCVRCVAAGRVISNRISAGATSASGVYLTNASPPVVAFNLIISGGGPHVNVSSTGAIAHIIGNTLAGAVGTSGVLYQSGMTALQFVFDNLITDCGAYGINGGNAASAIFSSQNRIDRCTSGAYNSATDWLASTKWGDDLTSITQANEYEAAGSGDYRLKSTSPAIGKGQWMLGDIGALQRYWRASDFANCTPGNILKDVVIDDVTGSFDEAARNTDPGVNYVIAGHAYKIHDVSKTGNNVQPDPSEVKSGVTYGPNP